MAEKPEILTFVDEMLEKANKRIKLEEDVKKQFDEKMKLLDSYGAVMLDNGMIIHVKFNFILFEDIWLQYVIAKELGDKEQMRSVLEATGGGLFNSGDITFKLSDVKMILKPQLYFNSPEEEKRRVDLKNGMINTYISDSIFTTESIFYQEEYVDDEDEE